MYNYPEYIEHMKMQGEEAMAKELDKLQTKLMEAQKVYHKLHGNREAMYKALFT